MARRAGASSARSDKLKLIPQNRFMMWGKLYLAQPGDARLVNLSWGRCDSTARP
jgi:hypothetical protein